MPLRSVSEYHRWIKREEPSVAAQQAARHFVAELGDEPWRHPSVPIEVLSQQPEYEVRQAAVEVDHEDRPVQVWYRHTYATGAVDLIAISNR